jgi:dihydrofolate reductase
MSKVTAQMSMSLDGFIAGPDPSQGNPLGTNGEKLHGWMFDNPDEGKALSSVLKRNSGAAIIGYNMYYEAIPHWGGTGALGDDIPSCVLTEEGKVPQGAPDVFTFVTDGIGSALEQARSVAGDKDVWIGGGANTVQQYLEAGLLDELQIHLVPVLLGGGTRLFGELGKSMELEQADVQQGKGVIHITYRLKK